MNKNKEELTIGREYYNNKVTKEVDVICQFDPLAADLYRDRKLFKLSYLEISALRGLKASFIKQKIKTAQSILNHRERLWCGGLSNRASRALLLAGYCCKLQIKQELKDGLFDLEDLENIGKKTRQEITRWLSRH